MSKNLNKHIKSDKLKWAFTGIILVLVFVMFVGMCLQLFGQGKVKPSEWLDKTPVENVETVEAVESDNALHSSIFVPSLLNDSEIANTASVVDYTRYITMENHADGLTLLGAYKRGDYDESAEYTLTITSKGDTFIPYRFGFNDLYCFIGLDIDGQAVTDLHFVRAPSFGSTVFNYNFECPPIFDNPEINPEFVIRINSQGVGIEFGGENLSDFGDPNAIGDIVSVFLETGSSTELFMGNLNGDVAFNEYTIEEKVVCENSEIVPLPPAPTKEGYTFKGWFLDEACTQRYTGTTITSDTVLYAGWEINNYTVTFNSDGGSNIAPQSVEYNKSANLATPTKEGYTFKGWFLADGTQYTNQAIKANMTLKAKWEIKKVSVVFNSDGGSNIVDQSVEYGKSASLETPTKEGYTFKGWFLADGTQYINQAIKASTTLKAKWEIKRFTVTFYVDGKVYNELTVDYGTRLQNVADRANVFSQNIVSYRFLNAELPVGEFGNMVVVDDMEVEANAPTEIDKAVGTIKNNWLPILLGGVGLIALIVITSLVATHKKRG